jgi:hypothetical protein
MSALEIIAAGLIAGAFMGMVSEFGYRLGVSKSNLFITDGQFATRLIGRGDRSALTYPFGIGIHLVTSAAFGAVYFGITEPFEITLHSAQYIAPYVFVLWLAMLFTALPMAGQGLLGRKSGRFAWAEQLVFHFVFGIGFWWALQVV